ncbi:hypothetical protein Lal_00042496 [Lupinus albus]|nr:hypothetical protein Lal_00042496 [Lupinus albus]
MQHSSRNALAGLLKQTKLIIWYEASVTQILQSQFKFWWKNHYIGRDFRQILPVIPRGSRSNIINIIINASYIWDSCYVLTGKKYVCKWIIDYMLLLKVPIANLYLNEEFIQCRVILASTIETGDKINDCALSLIRGKCFNLESFTQTIHVTFKTLTSYKRNLSLPNHKIKLKIGILIMLLRNLEQSKGLCNEIRMIVNRLTNHVIEARTMSSKNVSKIFYIPRMSLSPSHSPWPFKLTRRQFSLIVSYAITINKSQGQSLASVGVQTIERLKTLIHNKEGNPKNTTTNVVFEEVFQNL